MPQLRAKSLLLYKNQPAILTETGAKKISIRTPSGKASVRPKDVQLLHIGPIDSLGALSKTPAGDIETACELLEGETTTLEAISELAFDDFTPQTAWAVWQLLDDGLRFSGEIDAVYVRTTNEVAAIAAEREAKANEAAAWDAFVARVRAGAVGDEDGRFLQELIQFAQGQLPHSKLLKSLKIAETVENAHKLLLQLGVWDEAVNPYPYRAGVAVNPPRVPLPTTLPDEPRKDLTHLTALAIDDAGSNDPDDALSWDNGRIWVHIADVSALVAPDSPADLEARGRGSTLYLPEGKVTMLPEAATNALALGLQEISPALSFGFVLNDEAEIEDVEITPSWVKVTRTSYDAAETMLDKSPYRELFDAAQRYEARRHAFGAVEINLPEARVRVGEDGLVKIRPLPHLRSRALVRDAMLMAGEAAARFAFENNIPIPFTSQSPPTDELPPADTLAQNFARRRMMSPSQQGSTPAAHSGLGMGMYAQATSPLRRYLDLVVHQQLRAFLRRQPLMDSAAVMERVGAADAISREVRYASRRSDLHWTLVYLLQNPEWQGEAVVVDNRPKKCTIIVPELALDVQMRGERPLNSTLAVKMRHVKLSQLDVSFEEIVGD